MRSGQSKTSGSIASLISFQHNISPVPQRDRLRRKTIPTTWRRSVSFITHSSATYAARAATTWQSRIRTAQCSVSQLNLFSKNRHIDMCAGLCAQVHFIVYSFRKKEGSRLSTRGKLPSGFDADVLDQTTLGKRELFLSLECALRRGLKRWLRMPPD
jgi:hypothetical protein